MKLELVPKMQLVQKLAPQIIQSIEILQLQSLDLQELIQQELEENPVLELVEPKAETPALSTELEKNDPKTVESFEHLEAFESAGQMDDLYDSSDYYSKWNNTYDGEKDKKMEAMQNTASKPISLQDHLFRQIVLMDLDETLQLLCENIIYNIDHRGYLQYPLSEILNSLGDERLTLEKAEEALEIIHNLDPTGIGGANLTECLLLQLDPEHPDFPFQRYLLENHIDDITHNRLPKIAKETGKTLETLKRYIESFARLNPYPGSAFSDTTTHYIVPDVRVEYIDGEYVVRLEDGYIPELTVSQTYQKLLTTLKDSPQARSFLKQKMDSARWLIDSISQRQHTLYRVARAIIDYQKDFLDEGVKKLKPLKMQSIANDLGIHVSTVSRTINNKYVQTPRGIFPMKYFFSGATLSSDGTSESRVSVKQRVQEIIDQEDKNNPLSDEEIAEKLQLNGLDVARRTITKYRKALKIPSSHQRRHY
jgi:RNA polymerase sigma-54 factor